MIPGEQFPTLILESNHRFGIVRVNVTRPPRLAMATPVMANVPPGSAPRIHINAPSGKQRVKKPMRKAPMENTQREK